MYECSLMLNIELPFLCYSEFVLPFRSIVQFIDLFCFFAFNVDAKHLLIYTKIAELC